VGGEGTNYQNELYYYKGTNYISSKLIIKL